MLADIINSQCKQEQIKLIIVNSGINGSLLDSISSTVEVVCLNRRPGSVNPVPLIRLNWEIRRFKPNVIHCHNRNLVGGIWNRYFRRKSVLTIHNMGGSLKGIRKFGKCFAISEAVRKDVYNRSRLEIEAVYNGIRCADIVTRDKLVEVQADSLPVRVIQVSRLEHELKGQHLALLALKKLFDKGFASIELDLIGTGSSDGYLKDLARDLGIRDNVHFLGMKSRDYIYKHLHEYDLLIQPSLNEGFGLTIAEAMAAKIPVLVSDIEGPMELIGNGDYGDYFESGSMEDLARKLFDFLNLRGSKLLEERVERAYAFCRAHFDISVTAAAYIDRYKTV